MQDETIRWGEQVTLMPGIDQQASGDLVRVVLPVPVLCRLNLHAEVISGPTDDPLVRNVGLQLEYVVGTGSATATVMRTFLALPAVGPATPDPLGNVPLDWEIYMPLNRINARVRCFGTVPVVVAMWLTPLNERPPHVGSY